MKPRTLPSLLVALAALFVLGVVAAVPAAATPSKAADCSGCHGPGLGTYRGTTTASPSTQFPAAGATYTVAIGTPQNPIGTFNTGYWIANSTVAGATGTTTGVYGGGVGAVHSYTASMTAPAAAGVYYYKVFADDGAKDADAYVNFATYSITVDKTAPVTTAAGVSASWVLGPVTVNLSATDNAAGVQSTQYRVDGGPWVQGVSATLFTWRKGGGSGDRLVEFQSTDNVGNVEVIKSVHVKLDAKPPVTRSNAPAGVRNGPVTVTFTAKDPDSGVASTWYSVNDAAFVQGTQVTLSATPAGRTDSLYFYSIDNAGNIEVWVRTSVSF